MVLYHATFKRRLPQIIKYGLDSKHAKNWKDCEKGYVYFAQDYDIAYDFCEAAEDVQGEDYDSGIVVLAVDAKTLKKENFKPDGNIITPGHDGCFAYKGTVQAQKLRIVEIECIKGQCVYKFKPLK